MPVGAGDGALGRIEAALAADDPALVASFHSWGATPEDSGEDGACVVGRTTGLTLLLGLVALGVGTPGLLALLLMGGTLLACVATIRWMEHDPEPAG